MRYFQFDQSSSIVVGFVVGVFIAGLIDWKAEKMMKMFASLKAKPKEAELKQLGKVGTRVQERKDKTNFRKDEMKLVKRFKVGLDKIKRREKREVEKLTKREFSKFERKEIGRTRT